MAINSGDGSIDSELPVAAQIIFTYTDDSDCHDRLSVQLGLKAVLPLHFSLCVSIPPCQYPSGLALIPSICSFLCLIAWSQNGSYHDEANVKQSLQAAHLGGGTTAVRVIWL